MSVARWVVCCCRPDSSGGGYGGGPASERRRRPPHRHVRGGLDEALSPVADLNLLLPRMDRSRSGEACVLAAERQLSAGAGGGSSAVTVGNDHMQEWRTRRRKGWWGGAEKSPSTPIEGEDSARVGEPRAPDPLRLAQ